MTRRTLVLIALALTLVVPGVLSAKTGVGKPDKSGPQPMIEIPKMRVDFGSVFQRDKYEATFVVRNHGKADLVIEDVKPG